MDKDIASPITRRAFAATGLVAGFTLATGPLNAAAIVTDARPPRRFFDATVTGGRGQMKADSSNLFCHSPAQIPRGPGRWRGSRR